MVTYRKSTERKLRGDDDDVYVCYFYLLAVLRSRLRIMTHTGRFVHLRHCGDVTQVCYRDRQRDSTVVWWTNIFQCVSIF